MPKRNSNPTPPQPPTRRKPGPGGSQGPPDQGERVLLPLTRLNVQALTGLESGSPVSIRLAGRILKVYTPIGTFIGDVNDEAMGQVAGKRLHRAKVFDSRIKPPQCVIEVTI